MDVSFVLHDQSGAGEIVNWTDRQSEETDAGWMKHGRVVRDAPALHSLWWVIVHPGTSYRGLEKLVTPLLAVVEALGWGEVTEFDHLHHPEIPQLKQLSDLGVAHAKAIPPKIPHKGMVTFGHFGGGQSAGPEEVPAAVEQCLSSPQYADVLKKLASSGAVHRQAFIWFRDHRWGPWRAMQWPQLPTRRPELPTEVTAVWTAISPDFAWMCPRGGSWELVLLDPDSGIDSTPEATSQATPALGPELAVGAGQVERVVTRGPGPFVSATYQPAPGARCHLLTLMGQPLCSTTNDVTRLRNYAPDRVPDAQRCPICWARANAPTTEP